jgi:hypothetical protein
MVSTIGRVSALERHRRIHARRCAFTIAAVRRFTTVRAKRRSHKPAYCEAREDWSLCGRFGRDCEWSMKDRTQYAHGHDRRRWFEEYHDERRTSGQHPDRRG